MNPGSLRAQWEATADDHHGGTILGPTAWQQTSLRNSFFFWDIKTDAMEIESVHTFRKRTDECAHSFSFQFMLSLVLAQETTLFLSFLSRGYVFFCMWALPCSAETTIDGHSQTPAMKTNPRGDKETESRTNHGFYKLVIVLLWFPAMAHIYCKGKSTNNRFAWAPTVSQVVFRELQLNLSVPRCQKR